MLPRECLVVKSLLILNALCSKLVAQQIALFLQLVNEEMLVFLLLCPEDKHGSDHPSSG